MISKFQTFLDRDFSMKLLILKVSLMIAIFRIALDVVPFRKMVTILQKVAPPKENGLLFFDYSRGNIAWAVRKVSGILLKNRPCLVQAIVLWILYLRRGYDAKLYIGVKKDHPESIRAHAWVESGDFIAIGFVPDLGTYRVLPQFL